MDRTGTGQKDCKTKKKWSCPKTAKLKIGLDRLLMNHEWDRTGTGQKDCKTRPQNPRLSYAAHQNPRKTYHLELTCPTQEFPVLGQLSDTPKPPLPLFGTFQSLLFPHCFSINRTNTDFSSNSYNRQIHFPSMHADFADILVEDEEHQTYSFIFLPLLAVIFNLHKPMLVASPT